MANVKVTLDYQINDGMYLTFKAPCDSTEVTGLKVYYPTITDDASTDTTMTFSFRDAHGNNLANIGNLFKSGTYVTVILDTTNSMAYIQNADTNGYLENKFTGFQGHASNTTIHVMAEEKEAWNNQGADLETHTKDTNIHVTAEEKNTWNNAAPMWTYSQTDLTAGTSELETGHIYLVYE